MNVKLLKALCILVYKSRDQFLIVSDIAMFFKLHILEINSSWWKYLFLCSKSARIHLIYFYHVHLTFLHHDNNNFLNINFNLDLTSEYLHLYYKAYKRKTKIFLLLYILINSYPSYRLNLLRFDWFNRYWDPIISDTQLELSGLRIDIYRIPRREII